MPKIVIKNLADKTIMTNDKSATVLDTLQENFIDWMHACGGKGRCTSCRMIVKQGESNLAPITESENNYRMLNRLADNERLSCQSVLMDGEIDIEVPTATKLPHMEYSY